MNPTLQKLTTLLDEGLIEAIDLEFCRFLMEIEPNIEESVIWAACLTSRAYQDGNVCIRLEEYAGTFPFDDESAATDYVLPTLSEWVAVLEQSQVVGGPGDFKPLILDRANRLYFHKSWSFEQNLVTQILRRAENKSSGINKQLLADGLARLFASNNDQPDWQKIAVASAMLNRLTLISGGPGTGKTTTIVRLLALLLEQDQASGKFPVVTLAAPTGKAAARMEESITEAKTSLNIDDEIKNAIPVEAVTIHQLLGARRHTSQFRYNADNHLPADVVIVDEASMIDQALMNNLMKALPEKAKLVLLGDKDQLASVEAGAVMADICGDYISNQMSGGMAAELKELAIEIPDEHIKPDSPSLIDSIILLQKSYRFGDKSGIGLLADSINSGEAAQSQTILNDPQLPDATLIQKDSYAGYRSVIVDEVIKRFQSIPDSASPEEIFNIYSQFQLLSAHRRGPWGTDHLNKQIENGLIEKGLVSRYDEWYPGKPVIINRNDYSLGLNNGDLGVCAIDSDGNTKVFFNINNTFLDISPSRLPDFSTAFVLTVHKSQGSEFDNVWLVLPDKKSKVLSRELLYTAVTRARKSVTILGEDSVFRKSVNDELARNSGLKDYLWEKS